ncbi:MAG: redoxin domain-containing protein [Clostridia bacterium]|nr:redoxin domain-containing protein [Clostridia bacterium]
MKKIRSFSLFLALFLLFSFTSCVNESGEITTEYTKTVNTEVITQENTTGAEEVTTAAEETTAPPIDLSGMTVITLIPTTTAEPEVTTVPEPETTAEPEVTTVPEPETTAEPEVTTVPEPETTAKPEVTTVPEPETTTEPEVTTVPEPETTAEPEVTTVPEPETTAEPEVTTVPDPETTAEPEVTTVPEPETTAEPEVTTVPEPETTAEPEVTTVPEPETTAAPEVTTVPEPETTAAPEVTTIPEPDTTAAPEVTTVPEPETTAAPEATTEPEPEEEVNPAPDFTVYDRNGQPVRLSDMLGKPIVLNFWASWCGPCRSEMPDFDEVYRLLGDEVVFMLVNLTDGEVETMQSASAFIDSMGYSFPIYFDLTSEAAYTYGIRSIPTTYFISARGNLVAYAEGALDYETLLYAISMITQS